MKIALQWPAERKLLDLIAGGPENDEAIRRGVAAGVEWPALGALALEQRAAGVVWRRLSAARAAVPAEAAARLRALAMMADFDALALEQRLGDALGALAAAGIDVLLLKGAALAAQVYGGFPDRPMTDIDLLVRPAQAERAREVLVAAGWRWERDPQLDAFYASHQHLAPLHDTRPGGRTIELHTALLGGRHPFAWPVESLWANAERVRVAGREALAPSPVHQLLHACVHLAWSHILLSGGWRAFRDVDALARSGRVDWDAFVALARETRAATCCYWTLRLARACAGAHVPAEVERALAPRLPEPVRRRLTAHFALQLVSAGEACPSLRLTNALWTLAIQPGPSGHGDARPWERTEAYVPSDDPHLVPRPAERRGWRNALWHVRNTRPWRVYLAGLLAGRRSFVNAAL